MSELLHWLQIFIESGSLAEMKNPVAGTSVLHSTPCSSKKNHVLVVSLIPMPSR